MPCQFQKSVICSKNGNSHPQLNISFCPRWEPSVFPHIFVHINAQTFTAGRTHVNPASFSCCQFLIELIYLHWGWNKIFMLCTSSAYYIYVQSETLESLWFNPLRSFCKGPETCDTWTPILVFDKARAAANKRIEVDVGVSGALRKVSIVAISTLIFTSGRRHLTLRFFSWNRFCLCLVNDDVILRSTSIE